MPRNFSMIMVCAAAILALSAAMANAQLGQVQSNQAVDYSRVGLDQTKALKINDAIYQGIGFGNTFLITTEAGNVIIDTSLPYVAERHKKLLTAVSDKPVRYIILTHGHGDHTGGVRLWKSEGSDIVTSRLFPEFRAYQDRLSGYFAISNAAQFNFNLEQVKRAANSPLNVVKPTIVFDDRHELELGGLKLELFHTPGETPDAISVWIPQYKAAFVGDNFYDSFPNIYTLRGTPPRWALEYIASVDKVLALKPEVVLPSHGLPIVGAENVVKRLTKYRDAIQYVHDQTVKGMNEGKDVYTLMREIKLPADLDIGESYGKVSWSVRGIYEGYVGWFDMNPATMYSESPNVADADLVELAGGAAPVAKKAREVIAAGDTVRGLRLAEAALAREPANRDALEAKLLALDTLQKNTRNGLEHGWLGHGIRGVRKSLGAITAEKPAAK